MALSSSVIRKVDAAKKSGILNLRGLGLTELPNETYNRAGMDSFLDVLTLFYSLL